MTDLYPWPAIDRPALWEARGQRVRGLMSEKGLDHLLLVEPDNIRYATDYRSHLTNESDWHAAIVAETGESHVFVEYVDEVIAAPDPALPHLAALHAHPSWGPASANPRTWVGLIGTQLAASGARRVGVDAVEFRLFDALSETYPAIEFVSVSLELFQTRLIKDPIELELLEAASRVNSLAMDAAMRAVGPGTTDHEILAEAQRTQELLGTEYATHSVCNVRGASGAWFAKGKALEPGDAYFFDIGCYGVGGYASDAARTAFVGEPRPEVLAAYEHLLAAHELAQSLAVPGARASEIHEAVNSYLIGHGLGRTPYALGHGVGLRICELPTIARATLMDVDDTLREGMCIAIEPETSLEVDGQPVVLKVEDNFAVEANGLHAFTTPFSVEDSVRV